MSGWICCGTTDVTNPGPGLGVQNVAIKLHHKELTDPAAGLDDIDDTQYFGTLYKHLLVSGWSLLLLVTFLRLCHPTEVYVSLPE